MMKREERRVAILSVIGKERWSGREIEKETERGTVKEAWRENGTVNMNGTGAGIETENEIETEKETERGTDPTDVRESVQKEITSHSVFVNN